MMHSNCANLLFIHHEKNYWKTITSRLPEHGHMTHSRQHTNNTLKVTLINPLWYVNKLETYHRPHYSRTLTHDYLNHACLSYQLREPELSASGRVRVSVSPDILIYN